MLVGDFAWYFYHESCALSLEQHGCKVIRFGWNNCFIRRGSIDSPVPEYHSILHRIQHSLQTGPICWRINRRLLKVAREENPDIIWFYNVTIIPSRVVKKLRMLLPHTIFCQYSNDNPFSKKQKRGLWSNYLKSIKYFDLHFAYRHCNLVDYKRFGASNVYMLRSYYIEAEDYHIPVEQVPSKFHCDVVFAGHYEDDGRVKMLEAVCNAGYKLNLFGGGWDTALSRLQPDSPLRAKYPIVPVIGEDYRYAICGAKVALCFLSQLNEDTYTRRNFQICAMKTVMLSEYTDDLISLFVPDKEAMFFKDEFEMIKKIKLLVVDNQKRKEIAEAGRDKVRLAGHEVKKRMKEFLNKVSA